MAASEPKQQKPSVRAENPLLQRCKRRAKQVEARSADYILERLEYEIPSKKDVIVFVKVLEKSHNLYLFERYLREECPPIITRGPPIDTHALAFTFFKENQKTQRFKQIYGKDMTYAIDEYVSELCGRLPSGEERAIRHPWEFGGACYELLFQAREKGYVLDENVEAELMKFRKHPNHLCAIDWNTDMEARTVIVSGIPLDVDEKEIWCHFKSSGPITHIETQRSPDGQIALITFEHLKSVDYALKSSHTTRDLLPMKGRSSLYPLPPLYAGDTAHPPYRFPLYGYTPLVVQLKSGENAGCVKSVEKTEDVNSLYVEAIEKYSAIRSYYYEFQSKYGKSHAEEEPPLVVNCYDGFGVHRFSYPWFT